MVGLTEAARHRQVQVEIFFSGKGVLLTQEPDFARLAGQARLSVCDVSFRALELSGEVPGVGFKDFATQARNAEMVERSATGTWSFKGMLREFAPSFFRPPLLDPAMAVDSPCFCPPHSLFSGNIFDGPHNQRSIRPGLFCKLPEPAPGFNSSSPMRSTPELV
ncbi:MAG: hypothetical protein ACLFRL_01250 [Desulfohalobiaceae bacterium]